MFWRTTLLGWAIAATAAATPPAIAVKESEGAAGEVTLASLAKRFDDEETERLKKAPAAKRRSFADVANAVCYVAAEGYAPRMWPNSAAKPSGAPALDFLQGVKVLGILQGDTTFALVGEVERDVNAEGFRILGWVPERAVVRGNTCLRDDRTNIERKAVVLNSVEFLKTKGALQGREDLEPPQVLLNIEASPPAKSPRRLKFFEFFFVWADTAPGRDDEGYVLLAENPAFNRFGLKAAHPLQEIAKVIGWVPKKRICAWNTNEGFEWETQGNPKMPARGPAKGYGARDDAEGPAKIRGQPEEKFQEIEVFTRDGKPPVAAPTQMRFPRLDIPVVTDGGQLVARTHLDGYSVKPYDANRLFRVGIIGDLVNPGQADLPARTKELANMEIAKIRDQLKTTEILFVIDRTSSMDRWHKKTAEVVGELLKRVNGQSERLRVGFCYYSDVWENGREAKHAKENAGERAVTKAEAVRAGRIAWTGLLDTQAAARPGVTNRLDAELKALKEAKVQDAGLYPEMMYAGLEQGLLKAGWGSQTRKMVILIGDHGNHDLSKEGHAEERTAIVELLRPKTGAPIEFYALHVNTRPATQGERDAVKLFRDQVAALIADLERSNKSYYETLGPAAGQLDCPAEYFDLGESEDAFQTKTAKGYDRLRKRASELGTKFSEAQSGGARIEDPAVIAELMRIAEQVGLKRTEWRQLVEGVQAFSPQFVWEYDPKSGQRQLRRRVFVGQADVQLLVANMGKNMFDDRQEPRNIRDVMTIVVQAQSRRGANYDYSRMTEQEFRSCSDAGLSFLGELYEIHKSDDDRRFGELMFRLQKKFCRLEDLLAEQETVLLERADPKTGKRILAKGAVTRLPESRKRGHLKGDGTVYYWVDVEEEWP